MKPPRILLVDDNANFRDFLREQLRHAGYAVDEAANGRDGLAQFERSTADVVIVDLFMPEVEGVETIRKLRARSKDVKIIAISGGGEGGMFGMSSSLATAKLLGANEALRKPFDYAQLSDVLHRLLPPASAESP